MKAVVKYEEKPRATRLMDIEKPVCGEDQVLLKVMAAGVCGSDVDIWLSLIHILFIKKKVEVDY